VQYQDGDRVAFSRFTHVRVRVGSKNGATIAAIRCCGMGAENLYISGALK
jgi:hypothetical protein